MESLAQVAVKVRVRDGACHARISSSIFLAGRLVEGYLRHPAVKEDVFVADAHR